MGVSQICIAISYGIHYGTFFIFIEQLQYLLCSLCRDPSFGHFNKDGILDVMVEDDVGDYKKRVGFHSYFLGPTSSCCRFNLDY